MTESGFRTLAEVDSGSRAILERFGFDADAVRRPAGAPRRRATLSAASNVVSGAGRAAPGLRHRSRRPPGLGAVRRAGRGRPRRDRPRRGRPGRPRRRHGDAVRRGRQGRRRGARRAQLPLVEARRDGAARHETRGPTIPVALMTSFATDEATRAHVAALGVPTPLWFSQFVAPRLQRRRRRCSATPPAQVSLHGPGHGDLFEALQRSGVARAPRGRTASRSSTSRTSTTSARASTPSLVGEHLLGGRPVTVEVAREGRATRAVPRRASTAGSCSSRGRGFPAGFDQDAIPVFNTNNVVFDLDVLGGDVSARVDGRGEGRRTGWRRCSSSGSSTRSRGSSRRGSSRCRGPGRGDDSSRSRCPATSRPRARRSARCSSTSLA